MMTGEVKDAVVVGGGLAGMAAANYLAREGLAVAVLERADAAGGRARTRVHDGFAFNQGAHALYRRGAAAQVLRELEVPYRGADPRGPYLALRDGALLPLPTSTRALVTSRLLPLRAKLEVARWYTTLGRARPRELASTTAGEWLSRALPHPDARAFAETMMRVSTYSADTARHSAEAVAAQLQLARAGVLYLDGGWQSLVDGLRQGLARHGAALEAHAGVSAVRAADGGFEVALGDGRALRARAVVLAVPPRAAAEILGSAAPGVAAAAARAVPVRAACLDLALSALPRPDRLVALGVGRPLYFSVHSASARLAPAGGALVHTARYLGAGAADDPRAAEPELEQVMDQVQPGWRQVLVRRRFLPEMVVAQALVTAAGGGLAGRPAVEVPEMPGLYLAGDWVGADGILADAALASARRAAQALLARREKRPAA